MGVEQGSRVTEVEGLRHNCGLAGVRLNKPRPDIISSYLYPILQTIQNRGQEGVGVGLSNGTNWHIHKKSGLVAEVLSADSISRIEGEIQDPFLAIGQTRYSTSGKEKGAWQPFRHNRITLAHNGTLNNPLDLLDALPPNLQKRAQSDSWIAHQTIVRADGKTLQQKLQSSLESFEGAYTFIVSDGNKLFAVRDHKGWRPLSIGYLADDAGYVVSSETSAFSALGVTKSIEVREGEGVIIDENGVQTFFFDRRTDPEKFAHCILELIYFASPDSIVFGISVTEVRKELGRELARMDAEHGFLPDVIAPVQESGIIYAQGYSQEMILQVLADPARFGVDPKNAAEVVASLVPETGLVKNAYLGRAFLAPGSRRERAKLKHRPNEVVVQGKRVVVPEDSIIRSDTSSAVAENLWAAGASEVHFRVGSPPTRYPCYWGIDTPRESELIANVTNGDFNKIRKIITATSLAYVSDEQLLRAAVEVGNLKSSPDGDIYGEHGFCGHCFTGIKPVEVKNLFTKIRPS